MDIWWFIVLAAFIPIWVPAVAVLAGLSVWFLASIFAAVIALARDFVAPRPSHSA
jgi:uncharacterized membrane protein